MGWLLRVPKNVPSISVNEIMNRMTEIGKVECCIYLIKICYGLIDQVSENIEYTKINRANYRIGTIKGVLKNILTDLENKNGS